MISVLHSHDGYYYFLSVALSSNMHTHTHARAHVLRNEYLLFVTAAGSTHYVRPCGEGRAGILTYMYDV